MELDLSSTCWIPHPSLCPKKEHTSGDFTLKVAHGIQSTRSCVNHSQRSCTCKLPISGLNLHCSLTWSPLIATIVHVTEPQRGGGFWQPQVILLTFLWPSACHPGSHQAIGPDVVLPCFVTLVIELNSNLDSLETSKRVFYQFSQQCNIFLWDSY